MKYIYTKDNVNCLFKDTIRKISYSQLMSLFYKVKNDLMNKVKTGEGICGDLNNLILLDITKYYQDSIKNNWTIIDSQHEHITFELEYFIHNVLHKNLDILNEIPNVESVKYGRGNRYYDNRSTIKYINIID